MPKVKISEYSATANSNTDVASINIDEGCAPSGINNAIRAIMGHLKDFQQGTNGDPFNGPVNGTLGATTASTANVTTLTTSSTVTHNGGTANGVAYLNGSKVLTTGSALTFNGTDFATTGKVASGTTGAAGRFDLARASDGGVVVALGLSGNDFSANNGASGSYIFNINSSETLRLTSTSLYTASTINVGIGGSNPTSPLTISKAGATAIEISSGATYPVNSYGAGTGATQFAIANTGGTSYFGNESSTAGTSFTGTAAYATLLGTSAARSLQFATNSAVRATIDSSGNLLVGQTSISAAADGFFVSPNFSGTSGNCIVYAGCSGSTNSTTSYNLYSTGAGAFRFYVGLGGTIFATSIVITAISDQRLKENVRDIDTGLSSIMALKPRRFDWKEGKGQDKKNVAGFIAQEFETVFPECVSTSMAGADGIEYKNINHETLIPTLVKAIQEQQALITQLTARITALEGA